MLILPRPALAQTAPFDVTTSPHFFDISAQPGDTVKNKIMLRNNGDTPLLLKITVKRLLVDQNDNTVMEDIAPTDEAYTFIHIASSTAKFTALPKEWTGIPFSITIPKDANFGYDWALFISPQNAPTTEGVGTKITAAVAIPLLIDVNKDNAVVDGTITKFTTDQSWYELPPVTFLTTFRNKSTIHLQPTGNIFITDWTNQTVDTITVNKTFGAVLPNSQRTFSSIWDNGFITIEDKTVDGTVVRDKQGNPEKTWIFHFDRIFNFRIGTYTAHVLMVASGPKKDYSFEATTSFFVFPWKIIIVMILAVLLLIIGIISTTKSVSRTIINLSKKIFRRKKSQ